MDAYGWQGPWVTRRGFDSLVRMSAGIAHAGMESAAADKPTPLPVQALDHATGYLMAAAIVSALAEAAPGQTVMDARLSLVRTAELLATLAKGTDDDDITTAAPPDYSDITETSGWGPGNRLKPALTFGSATMQWSLPSAKLGSPTRYGLRSQAKPCAAWPNALAGVVSAVQLEGGRAP